MDYQGSKLFGLRPYLDHTLKLKMYNWEINYLWTFAKEIIQDNPMAAVGDTQKYFYIEFQRSMLHPRLNLKYGNYWKKLGSLEEWQHSLEKTIKLEILAEVVAHHLAADGQQPLTIKDDGQTLEPNAAHQKDPVEYAECD
ncbi:hypothetical protein BS17DRAFT_820779 [Gyrodon lividus]|nr:hypothetical protein BS17DRAFT_820779 [Gyrodon lividus]